MNVAARLEQAAGQGEVLLGEATYRLGEMPSWPSPRNRSRRRARAGRSRPGGYSACVRTSRPSRAPSRRRSSAAARSSASSARIRHAPSGSRRARSPRSSAPRDRQVPPGPGGASLVRDGGARRRRPVRRLRRRHHVSPARRVVRDVAGPDPEPALAELLANVERGEFATRLILAALGASDEPGSPEETAWAFRRLFEALAAARPLVVAVDDIHWAEPTLLDLLEYVLGFSGGAPILLLCLARPDLFDTRPSWAAPRPRASLVTLSALEPHESAALVEGLMHDAPVSPALRDRIVHAAEGNPLFVEQMLAMLADDPDAAEEAVPADDPRAPGGPHRPAGAGRASRSPASVGRGAAVPPRRGREAAAGGHGRSRRHAARPHAQGAHPARPLALRGRRRLPLQPCADPGRRLRIRAEGASRRAPRAACVLARGARRRAAGRAGGDRRLPPRAGLLEPGRRSAGSTTRPAPSRSGRDACSGVPDGARSTGTSSGRRRRSSSGHAACSRSSRPSGRRCSPTSAGRSAARAR